MSATHRPLINGCGCIYTSKNTIIASNYHMYMYSRHRVERMTFWPRHLIRMRRTFFSHKQNCLEILVLCQASAFYSHRYLLHRALSSHDVYCIYHKATFATSTTNWKFNLNLVSEICATQTNLNLKTSIVKQQKLTSVISKFCDHL